MVVSKRGWMAAMMCAAAFAGARARAQDSTPLPKVPAYRRRLLATFDESTGDPIPGVRITDVLTGTSMVTSATGLASLVFVPEGPRFVRLQKLGYEMQTLPVAIVATDTSGFTILMRRVTELPTVVTKDSTRSIPPRLRAFEERRKAGQGYFIGEEQLRKAEGRTLANTLAAYAPGMVIGRSTSKSLLLQSPRCMDGRATGPPQVYLDGVPVVDLQSGGRRAVANPPTDLSQFDVSDLAGVEWYPDSNMLPMEFNHSSGRCGALVLWTRDR
jgi:hypothetical protein